MLAKGDTLALFMEESVGKAEGKMGYGILRYSPNPVACVIDSVHAGKRLSDVIETPRDCPIVATVAEAKALGANVMVLGIAPSGGLLPEAWRKNLDEAIGLGMNLVNGLHESFNLSYPNLAPGQWIWDIRQEPTGLGPGTGKARLLPNKRVLMVGTDMAIGKMTAGLELYRLAREQGVNTEFVATGQIGITLTGRGIPLDAIRVDFAAGAVEREVMACAEADLVIVEGQGSLVHPGSTSNLPLLRGTCPTHLILCHRADQESLFRLPDIKIPPLNQFIKLYEDLSECVGTFPRAKMVGVALNTAHIASDKDALWACESIEKAVNLPCVDPVRHGCDRLLSAILN